MSQITKSFGYFWIIVLGIQLEPTQNIELISNYSVTVPLGLWMFK